jgi:putative CocE/NonD family hydrolase
MPQAGELLHTVVETHELGIVLADGCRLSARLWQPEGAGPVPCILEYIPYRKGDGTAARDAAMHPWFAARGYACLRVDLRGSGESDGLLTDEYTPQELADAVEVIAWAAAQDWCSGRVGMMGKSWGGFNCLQTAALRPPALGAVVTVCSTTDRFADDIHFKGGCLLGENFGWGSLMLAYNARPPDPALRSDWRTEWLRRLADNPHLSARWAGHQARDEFWQHGSVCQDWSAIQVPVLAWGGWNDGYMNTVSHLVENLSVPVQGIVGPWVHQYAHQAVPGPAVGFLQCALRWWDRWLKEEANGAESDAKMRLYRLHVAPPDPCAARLDGDWIALPDWPLEGRRGLHLTQAGLSEQAGPLAEVISTPQTLGFAAGEYFPMGLDAEMAGDQARDDAMSVCFDTPPLEATLSLVGQARLRLRLTSDQPLAFVVARLCAVMPDGCSTRLAHGFLNLCHRTSREAPEPVPVGQEIEIEVTLDQMAVDLQPGQRLRLALSNSLWPFVWPSPVSPRLTLHAGMLDLPIPSPPFATWQPPRPQAAPGLDIARLTPSHAARRIEKDLLAGTLALVVEDDSGWQRMPWGLETRAAMTERFEIAPDDPLSAKALITWNIDYRRPGWDSCIEVQAQMTCTATQFDLSARIIARENNEVVSDRQLQDTVPRLFV